MHRKGGDIMPHMVVATHGPETCAFPVQEVRDKALTALQRMVGLAKSSVAVSRVIGATCPAILSTWWSTHPMRTSSIR